MNPVEDRVRDALAAHAETFAASPDAWEYIQARTTRRTAGAGWLARHRTFLIPATAAAVVLAVALGAVALGHGITNAARPAVTPGAGTPTPEPPSGRLDSAMLAEYPPVSPLRTLGDGPQLATTFWVATVSPHYWLPMIVTGPQVCQLTWDQGGSTGACWPLPATSAATPAVVLDEDRPPPLWNKKTRRSTPESPVLTGVAEPAAASVTAVLPDGQRVRGTMGAFSGFPVKAWTVTGKLPTGTKLVFADSSGQVIGQIDATAPTGPATLDVPRPAHGGVALFDYPANGSLPPGTMDGYLVEGHVVFFTSGQTEALFDGAVSPHAAVAAPAVGGVAWYFKLACTPMCRDTHVKAFGYAHGDVAKVVVRLSGGGQAVADTFPAGWPGSDLRLWQVTLPDSVWPQDGSEPKLIATAYDAAGHVLGQVELGQPWG